MSQVTPPSSWALLLYACAERTSPFYPFSFSRLLLAAEMPPDAGHGKRESAPATISGCHVFPVLKPSCHAFANRAWQTRPFEDMCRRQKTCNRKPCTHDNDGCRTSVTAAGKRGFPLVRCAALWTSPWRVAPSSILPPFPFRLSSKYANVPMPPFQTASVAIFVAGAKVKTGLGTQIF